MPWTPQHPASTPPAVSSQVRGPGRSPRPGASRPVQGVAPGAPGGGAGREGGGPGGTLPSRPTDTPACVRGDEGRVLPGKHAEECGEDGCTGCRSCPGEHCWTCRRNHAAVTCPSCLALARANLAELDELVRELPAQAVNGRQAYHSHHGIPGGDALVMLTPASPYRDPRSTRPVYAEPGDPRPPLDVLVYWANVWRRREGVAAPRPATMGRVTGLLDSQLHRIAETPVFPQLAKDLARVLHSVQNVLHAGHRPDVSRVPCLSCGTRLVKVWADEEKRDHHRCPVCGETYDAGRYERAKHDQLYSRGADRFVPVSDALAVTGRPEQTVRTWMRQGLVTVRRDQAGRLLVWWPDVRDRHRETQRRKRSRP